jgi:hypothetical protein
MNTPNNDGSEESVLSMAASEFSAAVDAVIKRTASFEGTSAARKNAALNAAAKYLAGERSNWGGLKAKRFFSTEKARTLIPPDYNVSHDQVSVSRNYEHDDPLLLAVYETPGILSHPLLEKMTFDIALSEYYSGLRLALEPGIHGLNFGLSLVGNSGYFAPAEQNDYGWVEDIVDPKALSEDAANMMARALHGHSDSPAVALITPDQGMSTFPYLKRLLEPYRNASRLPTDDSLEYTDSTLDLIPSVTIRGGGLVEISANSYRPGNTRILLWDSSISSHDNVQIELTYLATLVETFFKLSQDQVDKGRIGYATITNGRSAGRVAEAGCRLLDAVIYGRPTEDLIHFDTLTNLSGEEISQD